MQQRILLAQALLHDPDILIMDEVATVLDRNRVENLMRVLTEMSSQVFVTTPSASDLGELANIADRVIEVMDGTIKAGN